MSWISENIAEFFTDLISGMLKAFGDAINNCFYEVVKIGTENVYVQNANKFLIVFALSAIAMLVGKIVLEGDVLEVDYDADEDPVNLLMRIAQTVAVVSCSGWIFNYIFQFSQDFTADVLSSSNATGVKDITNGLLNVENPAVDELLIFNMLINLMLIGYIVFAVVSGFRGAELIAMKLFTPLFALDLLNTNRERWNNFFMGYLLAFISYAFQTLFFMLSLYSYASVSINRMGYIISAFGWLIMAIIGPHFLEKYLYKSGVSKVAGSGLRMVVQTVMLKA